MKCMGPSGTNGPASAESADGAAIRSVTSIRLEGATGGVTSSGALFGGRPAPALKCRGQFLLIQGRNSIQYRSNG
jgi:hypothetical protein